MNVLRIRTAVLTCAQTVLEITAALVDLAIAWLVMHTGV